MKQVVCVSTSNYHPFPTRKQNIMNRLSDAQILYIDPPVSLLAPLKDPTAKARIFAYRKPGERVKDHLTVYAAPPVIPFFNRYRLINRINQMRLARYIKKRMKENGFTKPFLWCYSPTSCDLVAQIPNAGVIYDCVDRHSAYQGMIDPKVVDRMEEDLAKRASQVFCTAQGLYETLVQYQKNTKMIPNGAAYELFAQAAGPAPKKEGDGPIFGFVGMLQECIDYDLIRRLAIAHPEAEIHMIGRPLPGVDLSAISDLPNVKLLGLKPQTELPAYLKRFDVCLNLFRAGNLSKDVSPLKFYEYLATGKPIVSTKEPLQVSEFAEVTYICETEEDFVPMCEQALNEHDLEKSTKRMAFGKLCSWEERVKAMETVLQQNGVF